MRRRGAWRPAGVVGAFAAATAVTTAVYACGVRRAGIQARASISSAALVVDGAVLESGAVDAHAARRLAREVVVRDRDGAVVLSATLAELGASVDDGPLRTAVSTSGERGDPFFRRREAAAVAGGERGATAIVRLPAETVVERLKARKPATDRPPVASRWDRAQGRATPHQNGYRVDLHATVDAIAMAARGPANPIEVAWVVDVRVPPATQPIVAAIDQSAVISAYETRYGYVGNQVGRAQNVARAAQGIDGLVLMPGQTMSFNREVGPRSIANGFATAGEIYKGEMRMGIGGGTCQVASTFHAASYFGALSIVRRAPHSRPSGYIGVGLDATVAYPHVDLQVANPFSFPVVVAAHAEKGLMRIELRGAQKPAAVDYASETVRVSLYKRKVRTAAWLEEGKVIRKQAGRKGMTIEKVRTMRFADGRTEVETTRDVYPPTNEVFFVAAGTDEGEALPPLPPGVKRL